MKPTMEEKKKTNKNHCVFLLQQFTVIVVLTFFTPAISSTLPRSLDQILRLPGQPEVGFSQFSGYVTVNPERGRALFYWFFEAATSPQNKPLLLWLNGGPGCSSIAYGASEEIGPFRLHKDASSLFLNNFTWTNAANILFLESPAGVGFSYTNTTSDLPNSGDEQTASENLVFLLEWFSRFPEYKYREFYIAGESYAGHYIPQLALKIVHHNKGMSHPILNFKGFLVGNAVTDDYYDNIGTVAYWWTHSIISDASYRRIISACNFAANTTSAECNNAINYSMEHEFGNIDQYSIYTPSCRPRAPLPPSPLRFKGTLLRRRPSGYDPCTENYAEKYYNRPDVQLALHANSTAIPYKWTACSDVLLKNWKDSQKSMLPTYKELIAAGLRIWMFSGDADSIVPVTATRFSIGRLKLEVKRPWYPWYVKGQVGGWTEVYEGITFATVRGAGHEVPVLRPLPAFVLFQSFLAGKELPAK